MDLTIFDRLVLLGTMPKHTDYTTMRIVQTLIMKIGFSSQEKKAHNIRSEGSQAYWDNEISPVEIELDEIELGILRDGLSSAVIEWDKEKIITLKHMNVLDRFGVEFVPSETSTIKTAKEAVESKED